MGANLDVAVVALPISENPSLHEESLSRGNLFLCGSMVKGQAVPGSFCCVRCDCFAGGGAVFPTQALSFELPSSVFRVI